MHEVIRLVLVDDHPVTRAGIRAILEREPDIKIVGEAEDGEEAKELIHQLRPRILLLDLQMPGPPASEVERWVRARYPETITLILTAHDRDAYLANMIDEGVSGFLTKEEAPRRLVEAIRRAAQGKILFSQEQLNRASHWRSEVRERWKSLTDREQDVLLLLAEGKSNREIASELGIAEKTVEKHVSSTLSKLGMSSRTEAAVWGVRVEAMELRGGKG